MMKAFNYFALLLMLPVGSMAQREAKVSCDTVYYFSSDMTPHEARLEAIERARISAIADEFGTSVDQHLSTTITNDDQQSRTSMFFMGESDVRGVWVRDLEEPSVDVRVDGNFLITRVKVRGVAREREFADVLFDVRMYSRKEDNALPMKDVLSESRFYQRNGVPSDFFMKFKSPIKGYLLVYLIDEQGDAYLIVPSAEASGMAYSIVADKEYTFFSQTYADTSQAATDEIWIGATKRREINQLYVLFSPNRIPKAPTEQGHEIVMGNQSGYTPPFTAHKDFQKYLNRCFRDKEFQMRKYRISIEVRNQ